METPSVKDLKLPTFNPVFKPNKRDLNSGKRTMKGSPYTTFGIEDRVEDRTNRFSRLLTVSKIFYAS